MKYELTTLEDVFNLPDADTVERCMEELTAAMTGAKAVADLFDAVAGLEESPVEPLAAWPKVTTWDDDSKGEVSVRFHADIGGERTELISINQTVKREATP